jgi:hypothetical protein
MNRASWIRFTELSGPTSRIVRKAHEARRNHPPFDLDLLAHLEPEHVGILLYNGDASHAALVLQGRGGDT